MSQALLLACFLILVLWFGHDNHRSTEREAWRIGRQVFVMTGCLALAGVVLAVL
jgi:cytochrome c oxidase assembly factor CtaG